MTRNNEQKYKINTSADWLGETFYSIQDWPEFEEIMR